MVSREPVDLLLVEDDHRLAGLTARYLQQNGLRVVIESDGDKAIASFQREQPRIVLLDWMLPGKDGLSICRELRQTFSGPILIFTAKDSDIDQVIGLEAGADDFVSKPVEPMVLLARIRALLRRLEQAQEAPANPSEIVLGGLRISEASQRVWLDGTERLLTTQEFELLLVLARSPGTIFSRDMLFRRTRGIDYDGLDRSIDGRISKLRKKLDDNALTPTRIKTVWGKGYLLAPDAWGPTQ
ncbi:MAG TPA: response regulator [Xanthomonadales bacterium]|nr:response regulator [Xanthomonadales bacterium]